MVGYRHKATSCGKHLWSWLVVVLAGGAGVANVMASSSAATEHDRAAAALPLSHFQWYRVDPGSLFVPGGVRLADQFGRAKTVATQLLKLCAPVRKNGGDVANPRAGETQQ